MQSLTFVQSSPLPLPQSVVSHNEESCVSLVSFADISPETFTTP